MEGRQSRYQHLAETSSPQPPKRRKLAHHGPDDDIRWSRDGLLLSRDQYTIAWICALPIEMAAAQAMLDEVHKDLPRLMNDTNAYKLGSIENHNIVIACLPKARYGTNNASNVVTNLVRTFSSIRLGLMVGIGGGAPGPADIRLGDVVVGTFVTQYDLGKVIGDGQIQHTATPKIPDQLLSTAVSSLQAKHERNVGQVPSILRDRFEGLAGYGRPSSADCLFLSTYDHIFTVTPGCNECDHSKLVSRSWRSTYDPLIHYGGIASGNQVMRSATQRDRIARQLGVICFEMEAAGLMDILPCLPIRGICDYSDSHKNKEWQRYAAAAAAAYARELLTVLTVLPVVSAPNAPHNSFQVPFSLQGMPASDNFIDRPSDRAALEQYLLPERCPTERRKVCILYGLGGIGKTQLSIEFARRHKASFSAVFWLDGRSEDQLRQSLAKCAIRIPELRRTSCNSDVGLCSKDDFDAAVADVMEWLARPDNTRWLLIFDNVDQDYQQGGATGAYDLRQYLPGDHGSVLVTTRLSRLQQLERWYGEELDSDPAYETLLELLQGLPLALAQAASYMRETGIDVTSYIRIYNEQWTKLMNADDNPVTDYQQGSIATTWAVSLHTIKTQSNDSMNILRLWAFLDNKHFWHGILQGTVAPPFQKQWPTWLLDMAHDVTRFRKAMSLLLRFSMVQTRTEPKGSYTIHPVVHRWVSNLDDHRHKKEFARLALMLIGHSVPAREKKEYWTLQRRILPHAECCSLWMRKYVFELNKDTTSNCVISAIHYLGDLYADQGKLIEAKEMYDRALQGKEKTLGCDHTSTLDTVSNLGNLYAEQGKLVEAKRMYGRALQGYEKTLGCDHTSILNIVNNLGNLYAKQGKLVEAKEMYDRALQGKEKTLGCDHTSTLETVSNLGNLYAEQGKLIEAKEMYDRALQGYEKTLGRDHTSTLNTVSNLGNLYREQGKLVEAKEMYDRALQGKEKTLGCDHISTLNTVNNLGHLYVDQGKLIEAKEMYDRALQGKEKTLGRDHTSTLNTVNNLGSLYADQGKLVEAKEVYDRALQGYEKTLGRDHTSTLNTVNNLGNLYADQGKLVEAKEMYERALQGKEKTLGYDHTSTLNTVSNLGNLYAKQGKLVEAKEVYDRALQGYEKTLGCDHTSTLNIVNNLGLLYAKQGKLIEAKEMYDRALQGYEKTLGRDHTSTLNTVNNLGNLYADQGKLVEAKEMYDRALQGRRKTS
ncbi:pfs [Fusarium proliferatum]|nr:pfs [Fusarium proliferatum]